MHRRRFTQLLGSVALAPVFGCRKSEPDADVIARLMGLQANELSWLARLTPEQHQELRRALEKPDGDAADRAVRLAFAMVGERSRTFTFVGYPQVSDRRSVCDGLLNE